MSVNKSSTIITERVDNIPLLLTHLEQMGIPHLLDAHFPTHGNWKGLSLGWTATIWLVYIFYKADHRLNHVKNWIVQHLNTLCVCTGMPVRESDFTDDRLPIILRYLNKDSSWHAYERDQGDHLLRVYDLSTERVRFDSSTASNYVAVTKNCWLQLPHSKDQPHDLAQLKIMLASLEPLGLPILTSVVAGCRAHVPLYEHVIEQLRKSINRNRVLYVGDTKMAARQTRALIQDGNDYYLMPLPATIIYSLDTYLRPVLAGNQSLTPIYRKQLDGSQIKIAEGYEQTESITIELKGKTIAWDERCLIVRSPQHAAAQEATLVDNLAKAEAKIADLTSRRRGKKRITRLVELQFAVDKNLKHYQVEGLLEVNITETVIEHQVRSYRDRAAHSKVEKVFSLSVQINETAILAETSRMGWRVYATNASTESLSITEAVLAYREQYIVERSFGRIKGRSLSLTPMYLQRDDHATGLVRLLSIGLRVLTFGIFCVP